MEGHRLYDEDISAGSEQQAAVLRHVAEAPHRVPRDLDAAPWVIDRCPIPLDVFASDILDVETALAVVRRAGS